MSTWLLAFGVHSTLWCGLARLWTRVRPGTHPRLRELVWYTAIAASFITPTAQHFVSAESAFWRVPLPDAFASLRLGNVRIW